MNITMTRRHALAGVTAAILAVLAGGPARATVPAADGFIKSFADQLVGIVNGPQAKDVKKQALVPVIEQNVDVAYIARFCLGRAWNSATPAQQGKYVTLFHQVLLNNISGHLGDYQGVSYTLTGSRAQGDDTVVGTEIVRPNAPVADVQWVISTKSGSQKVVDLVAEGTSQRLTFRNDYASYLRQHGNDVDALLAAMQAQLNGN